MSAGRSPSAVPWSVPVAIADVPENGRHYKLTADEATRAQIAQLAGLRGLPRLEASFDVAREDTDSVRVEGEVSATVGQDCVVTLEPLNNEVKEAINVVFAPPRAPVDKGEERVGPSGPEPLTSDNIDLGVLAVEFLILGIDPYPRKPDAKFEPPAVKEDEESHPFAALAALKKGADSKK
jgi:uncharacterized metal-binding protein YceD (DUF177 family)